MESATVTKFKEVEQIPPLIKRLEKDEHSNRNALCDCGSGKKYKKCCYLKLRQGRIDLAEQQRIARAAAEICNGMDLSNCAEMVPLSDPNYAIS